MSQIITYLFDCYVFTLKRNIVVAVVESTDNFKHTDEAVFRDSEYLGLRSSPLYDGRNDIGFPNSAFLKAFWKEFVCWAGCLWYCWYGSRFSWLNLDVVLKIQVRICATVTTDYSPGWKGALCLSVGSSF